MARIKLIFLSLIVCIFCTIHPVLAEETMNLSILVTPQEVSFATCAKFFNIPADRLFYLAMAAANANRFTIDEIQSKTGYILFTAVNKQFLASVVKMDANRTLLKITPTNNVYYFPPGVVLNFFKYIELNANTPVSVINPEK